MPEIMIIDEILAPEWRLRLHFEGQNPFIVVTMVRLLLRQVMKIPGKDLFETDIRWDVTEDPRAFYGMWMGQRKEDRWTTTRIRIRAQGAQSLKDKTGWIDIEIKGTLETRYEYSNFIQRSFWWFFNYGFYWKQRRAYLDFAKDNMFLIKERIQRALGILPEGA